MKTLFKYSSEVPLEKLTSDLVVIGGGLSGTLASIAAARHGCTVVLAQNRPVLGGNASSEIGIGIAGASCAGGRWDSRETGILEEVQLAARKLDPTGGPASLDFALWQAVTAEDNITLLLNTHIADVTCKDGKILTVCGEQQGTEKRFELKAKWFADCTGDGTVAARAGCQFFLGREAKEDFGEPHALDIADNQTMGSSIYWVARDTGKPQPFTKPDWAYTYKKEDLKFRPIGAGRFKHGFWWVETGGDTDSTITHNEEIRDELWKIAFGLWDYVKNQGGDPEAENYVLDRVGLLPGKRESRRILGEYVLREQDLLEQTAFPDAIAYGGWTIDLHVPGGMRHLDEKPNYHISHGIYGIPWRCLLAKQCENLLLGGRLISATHLATASARVMATCAVIGQGLGTGVALAKAHECELRDIHVKHASELQQVLLRDDAFLPGVMNEDKTDLSLHARVSASSALVEAPPERILDRWQRNRPELRPDWIPNKKIHPPDENEVFANGSAWISKPFTVDPEPWLELSFESPVGISEIRPIFDTHLSLDISQFPQSDGAREGMPAVLVREYTIVANLNGRSVWQETVENNHRRNPLHILQECEADTIRLTIHKTWGGLHARVFALRIQSSY